MYGYVYITTNLVNGKKYIGKRKSSIFDTTYKGSGKILKEAFNKYGWENFETHILKELYGIPTVCNNLDELNTSEYLYTVIYNCVNSDEFYNLKYGGQGGSAPGYVCITNSEGLHKRVPREESLKYINCGWYFKGPIPSKETVLKRAISNTGKKRSLITCNNISKSLTGKIRKPLTEEHKLKLVKPCRENQPNNKKVKCKETNTIYFSIHEAARENNISASNISRNLKGGSSTKGLNWEYVN